MFVGHAANDGRGFLFQARIGRYENVSQVHAQEVWSAAESVKLGVDMKGGFWASALL
jgi:hypothetical protein